MSKSEKEDLVLAAFALTLGSIFIALPVHGGGFVVGGVAASGGTSYVVAYILGGVTSGLVGFVARDSISCIHGISKIYAGSNAGPRMSCVHTGETTSATRLSTAVQRLQRLCGSMQGNAQRRCERAFGYRVLWRCDQLDPVQVIQTTCEWEAQPGRGVQLQGRDQKAPAGCQWVLSSLQYAHLHKDVIHTQSADAPRSQAPLDLLSLKHKHPLQIHPNHQASPRNGRQIARCTARETSQKAPNQEIIIKQYPEKRYILGDKVVLDQDNIRGPDKVVEEEDVYKRLAVTSPHWNIDRLRSIVLESVRRASTVQKRSLTSGERSSHDKKAFKGWRVYDSSVPATRDLVEAVLVSLQDRPVDAEAYMPELCEALLYCPDRQMATLNMVYGALYAKRDAGSFECFVKNEIATLKRYILDMVVAPGLCTQNVHVQNYWRYELREKLGFMGKYKPRMGTFEQDRFGGQVGNVLDVFYTKFTPKYVVGKLAEEINGRKERLMEARAYLSGRLKGESYKRRVFEFENEEDADLLMPLRIMHSGVEDILEGMGILEWGVEETSRKGEQLYLFIERSKLTSCLKSRQRWSDSWSRQDDVRLDNSSLGKYAGRMRKYHREEFEPGQVVRIASRENQGATEKGTKGRFLKTGEVVMDSGGDSYLVRDDAGRLWVHEVANASFCFRNKGHEKVPIVVFEARDLKSLDLSHNRLATLPKEIGSLSQLRWLYLNHNQLTTLPKEIESLSQLKELRLCFNHLTTLPGEIGSLSQLRWLYLNHNQLTTLPKEIESLSQLQELSLCFNQLTELPGEIRSLSQLQKLTLGNNELTTLPGEIGSLSQLQKLILYHNQLTELPGEIGSLSQLQKLSLYRNRLTTLPGEIGSLSQLQKLSLGNNRLTTLPKEIGNLSDLQKLDLSENQHTELPKEIGNLSMLQGLSLGNNKLTALPGEIGSLSQLKKLSLYRNRLTALPGEIGSLSQLKDLYIRNNRLITLPKEIGRLSHLQKFDLSNNKLTTLPKEIGKLSQLQALDLSNNQLTELPGEIGWVSQLHGLYLGNNRLTTLPRSIAILPSITTLDLRNNPLEEHGEGDALGWRELRYILGDKVVLDQDNIRGPDKVVEEDDVYKRLAASSPHWNITRLRSIVLESVPKSKHSAEEILDIWRKRLARYAPVRTDGRDMESYIKFIYSTDREAFKGWRMYDSSVPATRDLVEAVMLKLGESRVDSEAYVPELCEALLYCTDRQMATLNMVYGALYAKRDARSFEYFVENEIATLKRYILDIVVTPGLGTQNVHVQNYWRYKLREKLGFKGEYKPRMGTFDQDRFGGHVGSVLDVFYTKFTPKYVVGKLAEEINGLKERLMMARAYMSGRLEDESYKRRVFEFENEEDADCLIPSRITHTGMEDILEGMGIIERVGEETFRKREQVGSRKRRASDSAEFEMVGSVHAMEISTWQDRPWTDGHDRCTVTARISDSSGAESANQSAKHTVGHNLLGRIGGVFHVWGS
ncbi:UNVERIFIED_CONTAM: hypothetical protein PYX00_011514 [Menopon gallinae]|uniref:Disease resistance R13L4/SHOC-2-like LRR domain-containing protein n=1 Tax=Menopon gallinae TaxID=328185 RepID=A0AAW2H7M9_9NEOP